MGNSRFIEEVKAAVSGEWPKDPKPKPKRIHKILEEVWEKAENGEDYEIKVSYQEPKTL